MGLPPFHSRVVHVFRVCVRGSLAMVPPHRAKRKQYLNLIDQGHQAARAAARQQDEEGHVRPAALVARGNTAKVPSWAYVLRAVLTNSPNSIPPERCFSILNDTFDDDQTRSGADYIEYSLQSQYNARGRA